MGGRSPRGIAALDPPLPAGERVGERAARLDPPLPAGERVGERGANMNSAAFQRVEDRLHDVVRAFKHVVVPETHHAKAVSFKPSGTSPVQRLGPIVAMRAPVDFEHQACAGGGCRVGVLGVGFWGLASAVALFAGRAVAARHMARRGVPTNVTNDIAFWAIVFGLIGARLYFDVQSGWWFYLTHPQHILAFWEGGMAFFGAIFAAVTVLVVMAWRRHINFCDLLDAG